MSGDYGGEHEKRDVPARVPIYVIVSTAVFVPIGALAIWLLMETAWRAPVQPPPVFPENSEPAQMAEPPLQQSPPGDMDRLRTRHNKRLQSAGWIARENNRVHMPIERAMDLLVERGLPQQGQAPSRSQSGPPSAPAQGGGAAP